MYPWKKYFLNKSYLFHEVIISPVPFIFYYLYGWLFSKFYKTCLDIKKYNLSWKSLWVSDKNGIQPFKNLLKLILSHSCKHGTLDDDHHCDHNVDYLFTKSNFNPSSPVKNTVVINDRWGKDARCRHGGFMTCDDRYNPGKNLWKSLILFSWLSYNYCWIFFIKFFSLSFILLNENSLKHARYFCVVI